MASNPANGSPDRPLASVRVKPQTHDLGLAGSDRELLLRGCLGPRVLRIHRVFLPVHHIIIDAVFHIRRGILPAKQFCVVGLVFGKEQRHAAFGVERIIGQPFLKQRVVVMDRNNTRALWTRRA